MKELISMYVSLFLVFSPAFAQSKFSVGTPTEDIKVWTLTLSNGEILTDVQFRELRGDYLDIIEMGFPRTIYIESIDKIISNKKKSYAGKGASYGFNLGLLIGGLSLLAAAVIAALPTSGGSSAGPLVVVVASSLILVGGPTALGALIGSQIKYIEEYDMSDWSIEEKRTQIQKLMKK